MARTVPVQRRDHPVDDRLLPAGPDPSEPPPHRTRPGEARVRRQIERDLVKLESDAATKEQQGRRIDARHRRATQALLDREEELVAGYPEMGYAGLVTVSARTQEDLDEQAEVVEQLARETGMDLRVLDARQDIAWAASLPLGLAPSTLLAS